MADFYDIDINFELDALGDIKLLTDQEAVEQSIKSILVTETGSRSGVGYANKEYGVGLNNFLFAPLTHFTAQSMSDSVYRHLSVFEPRIDIVNVNVNADIEAKQFAIELSYKLEGSTEVLTFRKVVTQL